MSDMTVLDYAMMVEDTYVPTSIIEYRLPGVENPDGSLTKQGRLIAVALSDIMGDGFSMVYSFFDPDFSARSLGTFMILDHIQRANDRGLPTSISATGSRAPARWNTRPASCPRII